MQGGRLRPHDPPASKPPAKKAAKPRGGMARWSFADGRDLLLTEAGTERRAGVWLVRVAERDTVAALGLLNP